MISFLGYPLNAGSAESVLLFRRAVAPKAIAVNPSYLPERINGAVAQSRLYHRVRMKFTNLRSWAALGTSGRSRLRRISENESIPDSAVDLLV